MLLDYPSLLVAIGFSTVCLVGILLASWIAARSDGFLLTSAVGCAFVVLFVFVFRVYLDTLDTRLAMLAVATLLTGFSVLMATGRQFRLGIAPWRRAGVVAALSLAVALPPFIAGLNALGFILFNAVGGVLLLATAWEYWRAREEARLALLTMCGLYAATAVTFLLCALALALEGRLAMDEAPSGPAEILNAIVSIVGVAGVGALTLAINQARIARAHRQDAMTDLLTGLVNRRALFDHVRDHPLQGDVAVALFDVDRFKTINDQHGHATGDRVLVAFGAALRANLAFDQIAARYGGEEFALILRGIGVETALRQTEAVRADFAARTRDELGLTCSASAGIAFAQPNGYDFEATLNAADEMLYQAKRSGRDRVAVASARLVTVVPLRPQPSSHP